MDDAAHSVRGRGAGRAFALAVALSIAAMALGACSAPLAASQPASSRSSPPSAADRPTLPAGFPVMPAASAVALPADPTVIASWTVAAVGSAAYDFYASALPAAGFAIVGLYPAERAALIRFEASADTVWQLLAEQIAGGTRITVRTDRA